MPLFRHAIRCALILGAIAASGTAALAQTTYPNDMKPSSILFFNRYVSSGENDPEKPPQADTQINITNTNSTEGIRLHLFFVDGKTCSIADAYSELTPNQTMSLFASDFDPGVQGYFVAVAMSNSTPTQFNFLVGDEYIREGDGRFARLAAVGIAKLSRGDVAVNDGTADLVFNGVEYERLPSSVAVSSFNSQVTDSTSIALYSPQRDLVVGGATTIPVPALVYDDAERSLSTSTSISCFSYFPITKFRVANGLNTAVPEGHTGWIRILSTGRPLLGAVFNYGPLFSGSINLHVLSLLNTYTITVPVF